MAGAQDFVCRIEAENATLTPPVKVKEVSADHSGGKYVGDNDPGSAIEFKVNIDKEGTYEFRTHYMCGDDSRGIYIRVQNYKEVTCKVPSTTDDWNLPPSKMMSANVYMDAGENTVIVTPYPNAGPNIDCFDIYTTKEVLTSDEAAQYMGISKSYLYKLTMRGEIPHYKPMGKMCYFNRAELEEWLQSNRVATATEIADRANQYCMKRK